MAEPRLPRRAQMRAASGRTDHFADGAGQLPHPNRIDSRALEPGHNVRLRIGNEGESIASRVQRGLGSPGEWHAQVAHVDRAGVHVHGEFHYTDTNGKTKVHTMKPHDDPVRVSHDDIAQVRWG